MRKRREKRRNMQYEQYEHKYSDSDNESDSFFFLLLNIIYKDGVKILLQYSHRAFADQLLCPTGKI